MPYYEGRAVCESLDSKLPLPRSNAESKAFGLIGGNWYFLDLSNPSKQSGIENWNDSEGQKIEEGYASKAGLENTLLII